MVEEIWDFEEDCCGWKGSQIGWASPVEGNQVSDVNDKDKGRSVVDVTPAEENKVWKLIRPRPWHDVLDVQVLVRWRALQTWECPSTPRGTFFEGVFDVEGGRTRSFCFDRWYARDLARGNKPTVRRLTQAQKILASQGTSRSMLKVMWTVVPVGCSHNGLGAHWRRERLEERASRKSGTARV